MGALWSRYLMSQVILTMLLLNHFLIDRTDGSLSRHVLHLRRNTRVRSLSIVYHLECGIILVVSIEIGFNNTLDVVIFIVLKRVLFIFVLLRLILLLLAVYEELCKRISTYSRLHVRRAQRSCCVNNELAFQNFGVHNCHYGFTKIRSNC